ncbi:MAG: biotin/lipoyl-containing protein [Rhodospirillaceae bacterium]
MRTFRITVEGTAYDVTVEELDAGTAAAPAPVRRAPVAAPVAAAPVVAAAPRPAPPSGGAGAVISPLAGTVTRIDVAVGQAVQAGQTVLMLEAMKMNTAISAPAAGTVSAVSVAAGTSVSEGQVLLTIA